MAKTALLISPANKAEQKPRNKRRKSSKNGSPNKLRNAMDGGPSFRFDGRNSLPEQWLRNKIGGAYSTLLHIQQIKLEGKTSWMTNNRDVFDNTLGDFDKWTPKPFDRLKISRQKDFFCGFGHPDDESSMNRNGRRVRWDYFAKFFVEFKWDN